MNNPHIGDLRPLPNQGAGGTLDKKTRLTRYEIQEAVDVGEEGATFTPPGLGSVVTAWRPVGVIDAAGGRAAIREWYYQQEGEDAPVTPFKMRAVPVRNITEVMVELQTHKQLTFE